MANSYEFAKKELNEVKNAGNFFMLRDGGDGIDVESRK